MSKFCLTLFSVMLATLSLAQKDTVDLTIYLDGFNKKDKVYMFIDDKSYEIYTNEAQKRANISLKASQLAQVSYKNKVKTFWFDKGELKLYISKSGFLKKTRLEGSKSQDLHEKILGATGEEKITLIEANIANPVVKNYMSYFSQTIPDEDKDRLIKLLPKSVGEYANYNIRRVKVDKENLVKRGDKIFDFKASTIDDQIINTEELRGTYILLDFASTRCGPCWDSYPYIKDLLSKANNLNVLTLVQDYSHETWHKVSENREISFTWAVLWKAENKREIFERYGVQGWPYYVLVAPDGTVAETLYSGNNKRLINMMKKYELIE